MHPYNIEDGKLFGLIRRLKVRTGACHLGVFIGDDGFKRDWLDEVIRTWERRITIISKTAVKFPQGSYAAVVCVIQSERIFLQCVTKNTGDIFAGVENILRGKLFSSPFLRKIKIIHTPHRSSK